MVDAVVVVACDEGCCELEPLGALEDDSEASELLPKDADELLDTLCDSAAA